MSVDTTPVIGTSSVFTSHAQNTSNNHSTNTPSPTLAAESTRMPARTTVPLSRVMTSIEYRNMRFVVFDAPTDTTLPIYLEELKARNVTDVVRVCEPTYNKDTVSACNIRVTDWPFADGSIPPANVIQGFLALCDERFPGGIAGAAAVAPGAEPDLSIPAIGIHCVAGLGRAPVLVAICLIEAGMAPLDAVEHIRRRRRGAFNNVQLTYLVETYKRSFKKAGKMSGFLVKRPATPSNGATAVAATPAAAGVDRNSDEGSSAASSGKTTLKSSFSKVFSFKKKETSPPL